MTPLKTYFDHLHPKFKWWSHSSVLLGQNGLKNHLYADEIQLHISFDNSALSSSLIVLSNVFFQFSLGWHQTFCPETDEKWVSPFSNFTATEEMSFFENYPSGHFCLTAQFSFYELSIVYDSKLSYNQYMNFICRSSQCHIRDIRRIRCHIFFSALVS